MLTAALQSTARAALVAQIVDLDREIARLDKRRVSLAAGDHRYEAQSAADRRRRTNHATTCVRIDAFRAEKAALLATLAVTP